CCHNGRIHRRGQLVDRLSRGVCRSPPFSIMNLEGYRLLSCFRSCLFPVFGNGLNQIFPFVRFFFGRQFLVRQTRKLPLQLIRFPTQRGRLAGGRRGDRQTCPLCLTLQLSSLIHHRMRQRRDLLLKLRGFGILAPVFWNI